MGSTRKDAVYRLLNIHIHITTKHWCLLSLAMAKRVVCVCVDVYSILMDFVVVIFRVGEDGPWDQVPQLNTETNATSYQVKSLVPFTVYSFRTLAVNKLGVSPPSKESYYIVSLREGKFKIQTLNYISSNQII